MNTTTQTPEEAPSPASEPKRGINWFRFWMQMLLAMLAFNIIAGLVTWYFIFPRLHTGQ